MPANQFNGYTDLGIGIGLRIPHYRHILSKKPVAGWFEIISENFMVEGGRPLEVLDEILEQYIVIQHGVALYFGSTDKLDPAQLKKLKQLIRRTKTPFISDHLCWGSADGHYSHDLLPIPYTFEAVTHTAAKIRQAMDYLEVPICVENVSSYAEFTQSEMTEWEFLAGVAEAADCDILLDVNNIYVNSVNHGYDAEAFLRAIPGERIAYAHIAGHYREADDFLIDTHGTEVIDPVWKLLGKAYELYGVFPTLLERDFEIPPLDALVHEVGMIRTIQDAWQTHHTQRSA